MKKLLFAFILTVLTIPTAYAREIAVDATTNANVRVQIGNTATGAQDDTEATSSTNRGSETHVGASTTAHVSGEATAESYRSAVATFVQSLLQTADRDGGIGVQVRAVAQSQRGSASTTAEAMTKVENRSKLASFLFGPDWKNIGVLRSTIARDTADLRSLEVAQKSTTNASVRVDLKSEIDTLKAEQQKIQDFVAAHEKSFSLFGWFTKLFVKTDAS